jgi:SCY1-like protein 2
VAVSTLNFLDPSTFAPKPREEKIAFMKGLQTVLPRFSEGMRRRKVLPSILAEVRKCLMLTMCRGDAVWVNVDMLYRR